MHSTAYYRVLDLTVYKRYDKPKQVPCVISICLRLLFFVVFLKPIEADLDDTEEPAPMYRLVLAGDAGAGKSSFLLRLTLNEFRGDIQTTLGGHHIKQSTLNKTLIDHV